VRLEFLRLLVRVKMSILERIETLKKSGNGFYRRSCQKISSSHSVSGDDRMTLLRLACVEYGKGLEEILKYEEEVRREDEGINSSDESDQLLVYKQQYYLNLGMMNFMLGDSHECRKCCNISLLFCNHCELLLSNLVDQEDKIETLVPILKPVVRRRFFSALVLILGAIESNAEETHCEDSILES
jgi:hypothetical protein